jgi:HD-GYP domain-containing protein (c-di-GMP phosphodiesterase class II)
LKKNGFEKKLYCSSNINLKVNQDSFEVNAVELSIYGEISGLELKEENLNLVLIPESRLSALSARYDKGLPENTGLLVYPDRKENNENHSGRFQSKILSYVLPEILEIPRIFNNEVQRSFEILENRKKLHDQEKRILLAENHIQELQNIGIALSTEKDIDLLLQTIVRLCMDVTRSDAGAIYLVEKDMEGEGQHLRFVLNQNDSLHIDSVPFTIPWNKKSLAGYVAITKQILNIADSYEIPEECEYSHSKKFDREYYYRTKSILTLPMMDHKDVLLGVIQLINKKTGYHKLRKEEDFDKYVVPYNEIDEKFAYSLASQAAVSLENVILYKNIQDLFEGFVKASVKAIESRDPATRGHSERVAFYSLEMAKKISEINKGAYRDVHFNDEELTELKYACLLHDFGKVGVREQILTKERKLLPYQLAEVMGRIEIIRKNLIIRSFSAKMALARENNADFKEKMNKIDEDLQKQIHLLEDYLKMILRFNEPTILDSEASHRLDEIAAYRYLGEDGKERTLLSEEEKKRLQIPRGSLTAEERQEMENHVEYSYQFLRQIPWTPEMSEIPDIVYAHHEKMNGGGYPRGINSSKIPLQSRIMAITDIYDALTASDRPYKKSLSSNRALEILEMEAKSGNLDTELLDIFVAENIYSRIPPEG